MRAWLSANRRVLLFLAVLALQGAANYATYVVVLQFAPWWIAFAAAVSVSLVLQTLLQFHLTFRQNLTATAGARYVAYQCVYTAVFGGCLGLVIANGFPAVFAPLVVLSVLTPLNFLITKRVIGAGATSGDAPA